MAEAGVQALLNEAALRRVDPYVNQVLDVAKYVAVYSFENNNWHKTGVEGSLFLYSRSAEPLYNILVLNRLNKNNLIEPVTEQMNFQMKDEFLLYKNSKGDIYGIWFFQKEDCPRINTLIAKVMTKTVPPIPPQVVSANEGPNVDIFKMLTKAQQAYTYSKDVQPIQQPRHQSPQEVPGTPKSVADFFAKAGGAPNSNQLPIESISKSRSISESEKPLLIHQLMSNPVHSVEHIEMQQRVVTPQSVDSNKMIIQNNLKGYHVENTQEHVFHRSHRPQETSSVEQSFQPRELMDPVVSQPRVNVGYKMCPPENSSSISFGVEGLKLERVNNGLSMKRISSPPGFGSIEERKPDLMPPAMFAPREPSHPPQPEPLTRNQLAQALDYLLRNDPEFMAKLHEAYVKSLTEKIL